MVTVSEQYKLEQDNKRLKEEKSKLLRYFVCEKIDEVIWMAGNWSHNNGILREKLDKIKKWRGNNFKLLEMVMSEKDYSTTGWCATIEGHFKEILDSQEKE